MHRVVSTSTPTNSPFSPAFSACALLVGMTAAPMVAEAFRKFLLSMMCPIEKRPLQ
jgi:hypothetical protein